MIIIIDYGMGNLGSIYNMFKHINVESKISKNPDEIGKAEKILLPGVGRFDAAIEKIRENGLKDILDQKVLVEKVPILGICLGMQILTSESAEGQSKGLNWISGQTIKFVFPDNSFKVPHMGWNMVRNSKENPLTHNLPDESRFYFVHSYYVRVEDEKNSLLKTNYGGIEFDSAIQRDNIWGTQFHPEKSHKYGMKLLENFSRI